jgi:hypothetical protein
MDVDAHRSEQDAQKSNMTLPVQDEIGAGKEKFRELFFRVDVLCIDDLWIEE